jgi:hypothetical protein
MSKYRPSSEINKDLKDLRIKNVEMPPPGTVNRKKILQAAIEDYKSQYYHPDRQQKIKALNLELKSAQKSERLKETIARKKADPKVQLQQFAHKKLKEFGFEREVKSSSGSAYYNNPVSQIRVRVSDHKIPSTAEREHNSENGGFTWSNNPNSLDSLENKMDVARWLVGVKRSHSSHRIFKNK